MKNESEKPSEGVYNKLRENSTLPGDGTDNYSRFADFNQEYSHLQRWPNIWIEKNTGSFVNCDKEVKGS